MAKQAASRTPLSREDAAQSQPIRHYVPVLVRCLIEHKGDIWQAFTLEFGLAAQGDSEADVKARLERMIESYLHDALVGEDREHAEELMSRRATLDVRLKYYLAAAIAKIRPNRTGGHSGGAYREPLALEPRLCSP
jgi:hypothetical protein